MLKDIEREVAAFLRRRRDRQASKGGQYSLWDDIAGVGEEFLEFLEEVRLTKGVGES